MENLKDFDFWFWNIIRVWIIIFDVWEIVNFWKYVDKLWISIIGTCICVIVFLGLLTFTIISTLSKIEELK